LVVTTLDISLNYRNCVMSGLSHVCMIYIQRVTGWILSSSPINLMFWNRILRRSWQTCYCWLIP